MGLAAFPLLRAGSLGPVVLAAGGLALILLLLALAGLIDLLPWSLALVGAGFVVVDAARSEPILMAPVFGAGLLIVGELAYGSRELARGAEEGLRRRAARLAVVAAAALAVAALPALATGFAPPTGAGASIVALATSVLLLLPAVLLLRGRRRRLDSSA